MLFGFKELVAKQHPTITAQMFRRNCGQIIHVVIECSVFRYGFKLPSTTTTDIVLQHLYTVYLGAAVVNIFTTSG